MTDRCQDSGEKTALHLRRNRQGEMMMQLRRIQDVGGEWWSVPPAPCCMVMPVSESEKGTSAMVLFRDGAPGILVEDRALAEYILTMRNPAEHCDPLPECVERAETWNTGNGHGAEARREGVARSELETFGGAPKTSQEEGWDAQQAIAVKFYAEHVVGWQ